MKKNNSLKRQTIFLVLGLIVFMQISLGVPYYLKIRKEYKHLTSLNPQEITLCLNKYQKKLDDREIDILMEQLTNKKISSHHSHPLKDFSVSIQLMMEYGESYMFEICPDSDIVGEYWIIEDGFDLRQIRSPWLKNLFKEINFFDHAVIIKKSN